MKSCNKCVTRFLIGQIYLLRNRKSFLTTVSFEIDFGKSGIKKGLVFYALFQHQLMYQKF